LNAYCQTISGSQISIPFHVVEKTGIVFEQPYNFTVTVIWAKPDGLADRKTQNVTIIWYNISIPNFRINYDASQILITSKQSSQFYLEPLNFPSTEFDIYNYDVKWSI